MSKKAEVKVTNDNMVMEVAGMFEEDAGSGMENMGAEDLALPFLKVLSGNDPVLDVLEDAKKGDIYNTVTGAFYKGSTGIKVIPCAYQRRFLQWSPRGEGSGAPIAIYKPEDNRPRTERSPDDNKEYVVDGNGTYIEETHQHFVIMGDDEQGYATALISMKSTQLKKSRKWNSMMQSVQLVGKNGPFTPPRFSHIYHLKTIKEENSKGSWHGWEVSRVGAITDVNLYKRCKDFAESIAKEEVVVKHEQEEVATTTDVPF
jgi:DNA-directed RNA polymerase subunit H (RpoH/RPB5)